MDNLVKLPGELPGGHLPGNRILLLGRLPSTPVIDGHSESTLARRHGRRPKRAGFLLTCDAIHRPGGITLSVGCGHPCVEASFGGQVSRNPIGGEEPMEYVVLELRVQHRVVVDELDPPAQRGCRAETLRLRLIERRILHLALSGSIRPVEPMFLRGLLHERATTY